MMELPRLRSKVKKNLAFEKTHVQENVARNLELPAKSLVELENLFEENYCGPIRQRIPTLVSFFGTNGIAKAPNVKVYHERLEAADIFRKNIKGDIFDQVANQLLENHVLPKENKNIGNSHGMSNIESRVTTLKCDPCGKTFFNDIRFKSHQESYHLKHKPLDLNSTLTEIGKITNMGNATNEKSTPNDDVQISNTRILNDNMSSVNNVHPRNDINVGNVGSDFINSNFSSNRMNKSCPTKNVANVEYDSLKLKVTTTIPENGTSPNLEGTLNAKNVNPTLNAIKEVNDAQNVESNLVVFPSNIEDLENLVADNFTAGSAREHLKILSKFFHPSKGLLFAIHDSDFSSKKDVIFNDNTPNFFEDTFFNQFVQHIDSLNKSMRCISVKDTYTLDDIDKEASNSFFKEQHKMVATPYICS